MGETMKKLTTYTAVLASVFFLAGCGGGGSNSAPANTTTTYKITNKTLDDFKSVSVVDASTGKEFQTGELDCASQATDCTFYYTGQTISTAESLVFKDSSGKVVAAYVSGYEPLEYEEVIVNPWSTGLYLYLQLNKNNPEIAALSQDTIEAKLHTFTGNYTSPDGMNDYYEEIAAYYGYERATHGLTIDAFLIRLAERLRDGDVAAASEFGPIVVASSAFQAIKMAYNQILLGEYPLIQSARANTGYGSCPSGVSAFLDVSGAIASGVQNAFPIAGTVANVVLSVSNSACNSSEPSLADIMNKLNAIQTSLDALHDDLRKLAALVADTNINSALSRFGDVAKEARTRGSNYESLVKTNSTSLLNYIKYTDHPKGDGTLEYVLRKYPNGALNNLMLSVLGSTGLVAKIDVLTDEKFNTMVSSIQSKCGDIRVGDIVSQRVQCNLAVSTSMGRLIAAQTVALKIAKDVYEVADAFSGEVANQYGFSGSGASAYAELKQKFESQLLSAKSSYQTYITNSNVNEKGYYNVYDGLTSTLFRNMEEVACWDNKLDVPAIGKWIREDNGNTEYLETNCRVGNSQNPSVVSRYFRKINGSSVGNDDVGNVMGVLVERRYITGPDYWYVGNRYTRGRDFRSSLYFKETMMPAYNNHFAINNSSDRDSNAVVPNTSKGYGPNLRKIKSQAEEWELGVSEWQFYEQDSGWSYNWTRYTDKKGYSYVFYIANKGGSSSYTGMYCVTGDCSIDSETGISFKKGPQGLVFLGGFGWVTKEDYRLYSKR